uniref:Glypican-6 n=1 Tax=Trichuris muris TaxID=70415 RepID=A0A5S6R4N4_TRIMR
MVDFVATIEAVHRKMAQSPLSVLLCCQLAILLGRSDIGGSKEATPTVDPLWAADNWNQTCDEVRSYFYERFAGVQGSNTPSKLSLPSDAFVNHRLKVCAKGLTCCTEEMENQFLLRSQHEFRRLVQDSIMNLVLAFKSRTNGFDRFFRELLAKSQRDLNKMFIKTYGILYEQNSDLFVSLFDNLTSYYTYKRKADGSVLASGDLDSIMDRFYENLYRRMFRMLNQPYQLDEDYWQCMSRHMHQLQPFGQVPEKMKLQVLKAFSSARTFIHALTVGSDVISDMLKMKPSAECVSQLTQMLHCQNCQGFAGQKPCSSFCLAVTSRCLVSYVVFDRHWNEYLESLLQLLDRLEGPYNIESVINPIDIQISEAIMIFQDRGKEISDKVFAGCGRPKITRTKRQTRSKMADQLKDLRFGPISARPSTVLGTSMDLLAKDMKEKALPTKGFWLHLPKKLCVKFHAAAAAAGSNRSDQYCWNGTSLQQQSDEPVDASAEQFDAETLLKDAEIEPAIREMVARIRRTVNELKKVMSFDPKERGRPVPSSAWKPSAKLGAQAASPIYEPAIEQSGYGSNDLFGSGGHEPAAPFGHVQTDDEDLIKEIGLKGGGDQGSGSGMGYPSESAVTHSPRDPMDVDDLYMTVDMSGVRLTLATHRPPPWVDADGRPVPDFEIGMHTTPPFILRPYSRPRDYDVFEATPPPSSCQHLAAYAYLVLLCSTLLLLMAERHLL